MIESPNKGGLALNINDTITNLCTIEAPWNKTITVQNLSYEGNMSTLRLRIREGRRFTDLELDVHSLRKLNTVLSDWLDSNS